jgi:hypothetical protein
MSQPDMKRLLLIITLVLIVFVVYNHQRIYLHDPFASVTQDDVKEEGVQVMINYSNDVLLEHAAAPRYVTLLQHGQPVGTPRVLQCMHFVGCMTEADVAPVLIANPIAHIESMSGTDVNFLDDSGRRIHVSLR